VRLLAVVVVLVGAMDLAASLRYDLFPRLVRVRDVLTPNVAGLANGLTALLGLLLVLVGRGLLGRRRLALWAAIGALLVSTVTHGIQGGGLTAAAVTVVLAAVLWRRRELFQADPGRTRWHSVLFALPVVLAVDLGYGLVGLVIGPDPAYPKLSPWRALDEVSQRLVGLDGPLHFRGSFGTWFLTSVSVIGIGSLVVLFAWALAPVAERLGNPDPGDRDELARLVHRGGADTLDPFVLRGDKRHAFAPDRRAAVGFRYLAGVGLASGDPVGEPDAAPAAVEAFLALCDRRGWRPAVYGVRDDRLWMYTRLGLHSIYIGDEAVVDVPAFSLEGRRMRNVRQAVSRTRNAGVTVRVCREGELGPELVEALLAIATVDNGRAAERGFSMGLDALLSGRDRDLVVVICFDRVGAPVAFQRYAPFGEARGLSLDAMRRLPGAPNGVNERMIVEAIEWGRPHGLRELSLNFAAFRRVLDRDRPVSRLRAVEIRALRTLEPMFQLDAIYRFNGKFQPRWVSRHIVYRAYADLASIGLAALSAEAYLPLGRAASLRSAEIAPPVRADEPVGAR
jgi:lysyl-tRNA synthetase class 2